MVNIEHNEVPRAAVESQEVGRDRSVAQAQDARPASPLSPSAPGPKSRDAARPFDPMPPRLRPPGTGTFRLRARPGSARASVSNSPQYVFVLAR